MIWWVTDFNILIFKWGEGVSHQYRVRLVRPASLLVADLLNFYLDIPKIDNEQFQKWTLGLSI
jgi:hypothetical protein